MQNKTLRKKMTLLQTSSIYPKRNTPLDEDDRCRTLPNSKHTCRRAAADSTKLSTQQQQRIILQQIWNSYQGCSASRVVVALIPGSPQTRPAAVQTPTQPPRPAPVKRQRLKQVHRPIKNTAVIKYRYTSYFYTCSMHWTAEPCLGRHRTSV